MNNILKNIVEMERLEASIAQQYGSVLTQKEALLRGIERLGTQGILSLRSNILIEDCNESLVEIPKFFIRKQNHPYFKVGSPYGEFSPFFVRESVVNALIKARRRLMEIDPELDILVYDGFRPVSVQQYMIVYSFLEECKNLNLKVDKLNFAQKTYLRDFVYNMWAPPHTEKSLPPPPHCTGAAIDVNIIRRKGDTWEELTMGVDFDGQPPEATTYHYHRRFEILEHHINNLDDALTNPMLLQERNNCEIIVSNRNILQEAMSYGGFYNIGAEVWHFSLGDQVASLIEGFQTGNYRIAKYGRVDHFIDGEPSEATLNLYHSIFPGKSTEQKTHQQILNEMMHFINHD